jgi:hypothetical protein
MDSKEVLIGRVSTNLVQSQPVLDILEVELVEKGEGSFQLHPSNIYPLLTLMIPFFRGPEEKEKVTIN